MLKGDPELGPVENVGVTGGPGGAQLGALLRGVVALLSLGAAAVHAFVIEAHLAEYWLFGVFFAVLALLQAAWAVAVLLRPTRRLLVLGAVGNAVVVGVWLVSRTAGLPVGPEAGSPEAVGFVDTAATVFEALLVVGVLALLNPRLAERPIARELVPAGAIASAVMIATVARDAFLAVGEESAREASDPASVSRALAGHMPHLILIGAAVVAFGAYVLIDVIRNGRPTLGPRRRLGPNAGTGKRPAATP